MTELRRSLGKSVIAAVAYKFSVMRFSKGRIRVGREFPPAPLTNRLTVMAQ